METLLTPTKREIYVTTYRLVEFMKSGGSISVRREIHENYLEVGDYDEYHDENGNLTEDRGNRVHIEHIDYDLSQRYSIEAAAQKVAEFTQGDVEQIKAAINSSLFDIR